MSLLKKILLIAANSLCLLLLLVLLLVSQNFAGLLTSQSAAKVWQGESEERFAQVSAFIPAGSALDEKSVYSFRDSVDAALVAAAIEKPEIGRLWADAYSGIGSIELTGSRGKSDATVFAVGGDFFLFHPYRLISGSYITGSDLMNDRIVLDEELAWKLFGATDLAGMEVTIRGTPYLIAGVVRRESDFASKDAGAAGPSVFMHYSAYSALSGDDEGIITCYEIVLPDQISDFAYNLVKDGFPAQNAELVQNTGRFGLEECFDTMSEFGKRSMRTNGVIYPYWENAARYIEDWLSLFLALAIVFAICPMVTGIWLLVRLYRFLKHRGGDIRAFVERKIEDYKRRRYEKTLEQEERDKLARAAALIDEVDIAAAVSAVIDEEKKETDKNS